MPGPSLQELKDKLSQYETAANDTEAKRIKRDADREAADAAVTQADTSHQAWLAALITQHSIDDEFDALSTAHEPPELPAV